MLDCPCTLQTSASRGRPSALWTALYLALHIWLAAFNLAPTAYCQGVTLLSRPGDLAVDLAVGSDLAVDLAVDLAGSSRGAGGDSRSRDSV